MLDWITRNHQIIGSVINLGMLVVWIVYLQVFVSNYRRQTRAHILINLGSGSGLDARCLVSNMSSEPIYIQSIIIEWDMPDSYHSRPVTELDGVEEWDEPSDLDLWTRQGPLGAGQIRDMGAFRAMLEHALSGRSDAGEDPGADAWDDLVAFEVKIIAVYGSEDLPVGAKRRFDILRKHGTTTLSPQTVGAQQIRSRGERRAIKSALDREVR